MSIDKLQNRIRKMKNPSVILFSMDISKVPATYQTGNIVVDYLQYTKAVLTALQNVVPAVRFDFNTFAIAGGEGICALTELIQIANELGYYVILDAPAVHTPGAAQYIAEELPVKWKYDGLILNCYIGSEGVKPFVEQIAKSEQDLFVMMRTANKSASEIQDLLTGTRLVYTVVADMAKRLGEDLTTRCGYSRIGGVGPATSAETLQQLRAKYPTMFLLIDGYDYSGANAKNCSMAFDKFGHGVVACASDCVLGAWLDDSGDPVDLAVMAAERMKKNLTRYIDIL
jgi:orotidine-5'-phosphate decarboxylase